MASERTRYRPTPKPFQGKKKQRWPMRILVTLVSVSGLLGLWQFVAHEPAASAQGTPSFQEVEQQLHLGNSSESSSGIFSIQNAPSAPNVISGMS